MNHIAMDDTKNEDQDLLKDMVIDDDKVDLEHGFVVALAEIKKLKKQNPNLVDLLQVESEENLKISITLREVKKNIFDLKIQIEEAKIIHENLEN